MVIARILFFFFKFRFYFCIKTKSSEDKLREEFKILVSGYFPCTPMSKLDYALIRKQEASAFVIGLFGSFMLSVQFQIMAVNLQH